MVEKQKRQFVIIKSLVTNSEGKILLVRRDRKWHKEAHNKWEFPGGKVDFGESPEKACIREVKEESGYDVMISRLIPKIISAKWEYEDKISQQILIAYHCILVKGHASTNDHGVSEVGWFSLDEIKQLDCLPGTIEFLIYYEISESL